MRRWIAVCAVACAVALNAKAQSTVYREGFDGPDIAAGQSVKEQPLAWTLLGPNDPSKSLVGDLMLGRGRDGWSGNYLDGSTAAVADAENSFQKTFSAMVCGQVVLTYKAFAAGESSAGSSVGLSAMQPRFSNRGGGWISTPTGWTFWTGHVDSSTYPLGEQKFGPYEILQDPMTGAHDVSVSFTMTVDLDRSKAWGEATWTDAKGAEQHFRSRELDWDTAGGDISSIIVTMDKRSGHTGISVDDIEVTGVTATPQPHPFAQREHAVRQMNGDTEAASIPAEMQWISQPWGGENAQMPYLAYMPEKGRVLMLVECGSPIHTALIESGDDGKTWGERRWLSVDKDGKPNAGALGLTYFGNGTLMAYPENMSSFWVSKDYGQSWALQESKASEGERYSWDPMLVLDATRVAQAWWRPTGIPWGSAEAPYSQAYIRFSSDAAQSWGEDTKVPQWLGVNEVDLIRAANGDWTAACRTDNPKRFAHWGFDHYSGLAVSISKDEGKTWSELNLLYEWGRHHPSMILLPDGRILMTYVVRLGYPNTKDGFEQFGVEAVVSNDNGQTWDLEHRYILAVWTGNIKGENAWFCGVQSTSTIVLSDGTILTAFGTGFRNQPGTAKCVMDVAMVRWRMQP